MDNHAWISTDLMLASIVIIAIISSFITITEERIEAADSIDQMSHARILAESIAETIELVYSGGENNYILFKMPPNLANKPYSIQINSSGVYVRYGKMMGSAFISQIVISGNPTSNISMLPYKSYNISNVKDEFGNTEIMIKDTD